MAEYARSLGSLPQAVPVTANEYLRLILSIAISSLFFVFWVIN